MPPFKTKYLEQQKGRYFHRLHVVLHVLQGANSYEAARIYSHSARSVQYWIKRLISEGLYGLWDKERPGRPSRLSKRDEQRLRDEIRCSPRELGYDQNPWDDPLLFHHLKEHYATSLSVRHCQNLFHRLGFTLQRPRRKDYKADPIKQEEFKKILPIDE